MHTRLSFPALFAAVLLTFGVAACNKSSPAAPTPTAPGLALSSTTIAFNAQAVGTTSAAQTLTLTNNDGSTVTVGSVQINGSEFSLTNGCGATLNAGANCTVTITFTPSAIGTRTGALQINDNASNGPHVVPLSGTGGFGQVLDLQPPNITFPLVLVGTSAAVTMTLANNGAGTVTVSGVAATGDFSSTTTCAGALAAASTCAITIQFSPTAAGNRTGTVTVSDDAPGNPHTATLAGTGYARGPLVSLVHSSLAFGGQAVGSTSAPATAQFMNIGTDALSISGISTTPEFAQTNSCGAALAPQAICTMSVTFNPAAAGTRTGTLTIRDNAPGGFQSITLTGTGTDASSGSGPLVGLAPTSLSFGNVGIGSVSAAQTVTVTNRGAAPLSIGSAGTTGDFGQTSGCDAAIAPGASCAIKVTFAPTTPGSRVGLLTLNDNAPGSPHSVPLAGTGTGSVNPSLVISPTSLAFGAQLIGTTSAVQRATLTNSGGSPLAISSVSVDGADFAQTNSCGAPVPSGGTCAIDVTFTPSVVGTRTGKVTIVDNAAGSPHAIGLAGSGGVGQISLSPASLDFGNQTVGTSSSVGSFAIQNTGAVNVTLTGITASGDFDQTNTCGQVLGPSGTCTVTVTFTPTAAGRRNGTITIVHDAPGSPQQVVLTGAGF